MDADKKSLLHWIISATKGIIVCIIPLFKPDNYMLVIKYLEGPVLRLP